MIASNEEWIYFTCFPAVGTLTSRKTRVRRDDVKEYGETLELDEASPRCWLKTPSEVYLVEASFDEVDTVMQSPGFSEVEPEKGAS